MRCPRSATTAGALFGLGDAHRRVSVVGDDRESRFCGEQQRDATLVAFVRGDEQRRGAGILHDVPPCSRIKQHLHAHLGEGRPSGAALSRTYADAPIRAAVMPVIDIGLLLGRKLTRLALVASSLLRASMTLIQPRVVPEARRVDVCTRIDEQLVSSEVGRLTPHGYPAGDGSARRRGREPRGRAPSRAAPARPPRLARWSQDQGRHEPESARQQTVLIHHPHGRRGTPNIAAENAVDVGDESNAYGSSHGYLGSSTSGCGVLTKLERHDPWNACPHHVLTAMQTAKLSSDATRTVSWIWTSPEPCRPHRCHRRACRHGVQKTA